MMKRTLFVGLAILGFAGGGVAAADETSKPGSKASVPAKGGADKTGGDKAATKSAAAKAGNSKAVTPSGTAGPVGAAGVPVKKERVIDFTKEEEIRGVLTKPEAELVGARRRVQSKSLLPIRLHFIPEMMKTVQDL
jgi:hypothetical protein